MKAILFRLFPLLILSFGAVVYGINLVYPLPKEVFTATHFIIGGAFIFYAVKKKGLTTWILTSMILGIIIGVEHPEVALSLQPLSSGFIKLVKTIVGPILFATLVYGIAGHSDLKQVGRMAWKSLLYFNIATTFAIFIGLAAINISKAGVGIDLSKLPQHELPKNTEAKASDIKALENIPENYQWIYKTASFFRDIFPENIIKSIYENQVLQIVVFSVFFGIGLAMLDEKKKKPLIDFVESLSETMFKYTRIVMYFAPIGVGAAIAFAVGYLGADVLKYLFLLLLTLYAALAGFILMVLLPLALYLKIPIKNFISAIKEPVSIAFATTSSDAALPKVMTNMEAFGVPRRIVSFVVPTGYSFNLDGTALYLSLTAVFVAQAAGIDMPVGQQLLMCLTLMITSKGVAAIPRAALIILTATADQFGLPLIILSAVLGIDELMDMGRTSLNVIGNCMASVIIAKWEGEFDQEKAENYTG